MNRRSSAVIVEMRPQSERAYDVEKIRADFPILKRMVRGKPLVYLDNAATTQKPQVVIDAVTRAYTEYNSNVHRGVHLLSQIATDEYENAREKLRRFIHARSTRETIFTRNTTEAINLVAHSYGRTNLRAGDEVLITEMEHHSNIVPWQMACETTGARLRVAPINDAGEVILEEYENLLSEKTKIVSITHLSNALGTINPVKEMTAKAHAAGAVVLVDGAQAVSHLKVDVQDLDCDFYAFSGHKMFGPTGVGMLYGKEAWLEKMPPFMGGGDMIRSVTFEKTLYNELPYKFEAGTPNIVDGVGLGAAVDYLEHLGRKAVAEYELDLLDYATQALACHPKIRLIGTAKEKASVLSFVVDGVHPHDLGTIVDQEGVAIRTGHHCAQPVMDRFGIPATSRASLALYNTRPEIDVLVQAIDKAIEVFAS